MGKERSVTSDQLFDLRQLSDMAIRALSSGINDPTTAVSCIDALTTLLIQLEHHALLSPYRCDDAGALRMITPVLTFDEMVRQGFDQVREYGTDDVAATVRLLHACGEITKFSTHPPHHTVLWQFINDVVDSAEQTLQGNTNRSVVNRQIRTINPLFQQGHIPELSTKQGSSRSS